MKHADANGERERQELIRQFDSIFDRMLGLPTLFDSDEMRVMEKVQGALFAVSETAMPDVCPTCGTTDGYVPAGSTPSATRLNYPHPAPDASEPMVANGIYQVLPLGGQPASVTTATGATLPLNWREVNRPDDKHERMTWYMDRLNEAVMSVPPTSEGRQKLEVAWDDLHSFLVSRYIRAPVSATRLTIGTTSPDCKVTVERLGDTPTQSIKDEIGQLFDRMKKDITASQFAHAERYNQGLWDMAKAAIEAVDQPRYVHSTVKEKS